MGSWIWIKIATPNKDQFCSLPILDYMVGAQFNIICSIFRISYLNNFLKTRKILLKNINGTEQENELKLWISIFQKAH